jgi:hypothetical protein
MDTELFKEWFQAFAQHAGLTLHVENLPVPDTPSLKAAQTSNRESEC